jgi:membrane protein implicated in regulation of membrane protease activity
MRAIKFLTWFWVISFLLLVGVYQVLPDFSKWAVAGEVKLALTVMLVAAWVWAWAGLVILPLVWLTVLILRLGRKSKLTDAEIAEVVRQRAVAQGRQVDARGVPR